MGHNFVDLIPLDDRPTVVETRESLARASLTSKFQTTTMFPGVLMHMLIMFLVQFLKLLVVSEKGGERIVLLLVCLLPRSLANRVLV